MKKIIFILSAMFIWISTNRVSAQALNDFDSGPVMLVTVAVCNNMRLPQDITCQIIDYQTLTYLYDKTFYNVPIQMCQGDSRKILLKPNTTYLVNAGANSNFRLIPISLSSSQSTIIVEQDMATGTPTVRVL